MVDYSVEPSLMKFGEKIFLKILEIYLKSMVTKEHIVNNGELYLLIDMAFLFSLNVIKRYILLDIRY